MGRRRQHDKGLPSRVYLRHGAHYHVGADGKWRRLAREGDLAGMHRALANLADSGGTRLADILDRYERDILPNKASATQRDQRKQLAILRRDFGKAGPADVKSSHVAEFLDVYPSKVAANRIVSLLSHVYTKAIRWGLVESNPCRGVERNPDGKRSVYVESVLFWQTWQAAPIRLQLAMELALITGQRQGDLLRLRWADCKDDGLHFTQGKTGSRVIIEWSEWSRDLLARCKDAQSAAQSFYVLADAHGQRVTSSGFQSAWQRFMMDRPERFQFRDLRKKSANDGATGEHLGHRDPRTLRNWYMLKPTRAAGVTGRE